MNILIILAVAAVLHIVTPQPQIPGITPKPTAQKKAEAARDTAETQKKALDEQVTAISSKAQALMDKLVAEGKARQAAEDATAAHVARNKKAANANAKTTAIFRKLHKPGNRLELVVAMNAEEVAAAVGEGDVDQLEAMRRSLDEALTSNEDLAAESQANQAAAQSARGAVEQTTKLLTQAQTDLKAANTKADLALQRAERAEASALAEAGAAKEAIAAKNDLLEELQHVARVAGGFLALAGLLTTAVGAKLARLAVMTAGVLAVLVGGLVFFIPVIIYFYIAGAALVGLLAYVAFHWHKEFSAAQNMVGILQEAKVAAPEAWKTTIAPIAAQYWGESKQAVAKADTYVAGHLKQLNFLPQK